MSKTPAQIPDAIGLQHLSSVKDVEGTAKHLESAIDGLIDAREIKADADSRRVWKNCVKHWYKAIYPYVSFGLGQVAVLYTFRRPSLQPGFCPHSVWIRCQRRTLYSGGFYFLAHR